MKIVFTLGITIGLTLASLASADMTMSKNSKQGGLVGNGGGTVVCRDASTRHINRIELLDFYESMLHPGMKIDIQSINGNWKEKAAEVISRVRPKSEMRYKLYSFWLAQFEEERQMLHDVQFSTVPDSGYISVPTGCIFEQAAIQRKPIFSGDARYYVNSELWEAMDDNQKAGLVLHEMIYREAIAYGHTDSIRARYLTGLYASEGFATQDVKQYWKVLDQAHFELVDVKIDAPFKGTISSWLNTTRLWQAGPDEVNYPRSIQLEDELLISLGECSKDGCDSFDSHFTNLYGFSQTPGGNFYASFTLPGDLFTMKVGENRFATITFVDMNHNPPAAGSYQGIQIRMNTDSSNQNAWMYVSASPENNFGVVGEKGRVVLGASQISFDKSANQNWVWTSTIGGSINEKMMGVDPAPGEGIPIVSGFGHCGEALVTYANDLIDTIQLGRTIHSTNEVTCKNTVLAVSTFTNGQGGTELLPSTPTAKYIRGATPNSLILPGLLSEWRPAYGSMTCEESNCLSPTVNDGFSVTQLKVSQKGAKVALSCMELTPPPSSGSGPVFGQACGVPVTNIQGNTRIELYPNGVPKSFIVGETSSVLDPSGSIVTVSSGTQIEVSEKGIVTAIHE